jgi:hypothetical protein
MKDKEINLKSMCHNCIAVPIDCDYKYAPREKCRCSCHRYDKKK